MPRRHALGQQYLTNHRGEAADHVVVGHGPGADATFAMAVDTVVGEDRRNGVSVGNLGAVKVWISPDILSIKKNETIIDCINPDCAAGGVCAGF